MPPKKKVRSEPRRKRKFYGNRFTKRKEASLATNGSESSSEYNPPIEEEEVRPIVGQSADCVLETPVAIRQHFKSLLASVRKLADVTSSSSSADSSCSTESDIDFVQENEGYRFVDMEILSTVIELLICPKCKLGHVTINEDATAKKGFASKLSVSCQRVACSFQEDFYTSKRVGKAFEVNRRAVLGANCPSKQTQIYQTVILRQYRCGVFERWGLWGGGRIVAATMVVGGVLSTGASAAQHRRLCWPDVQCETDPSMYPYVIV